MVSTNPEYIVTFMKILQQFEWKLGEIPHLWKGYTAERVVQDVLTLKNNG